MNEQLNSAQLQAVRATADRQILQYIEQIQLRKWAMEQALTRIGSESNLVQLAQQIYDFVYARPSSIIDPDKPF